MHLALQQLYPYAERATLIGSGGIRSGIDMVKAMVMGASLCGIARPFIDHAKESPESVIEYIEVLKKEFRIAMFLLGVENVGDLVGNDSVVRSRDGVVLVK